jgi:hypothetical protein
VAMIADAAVCIIATGLGAKIFRWEIITWAAVVIIWAAEVLALQRQVRDQKERLEIQRLMLQDSLHDPWRQL